MAITYVIPDIHGRADLLRDGLAGIAAHARSRIGTIVALGDYVDKGPDNKAVLDLLRGDASLVPEDDIKWLDELPLIHTDRHRIYVHAGLDPDVPLDKQSEKTLLWKRYPGGSTSGFDGCYVVHGHNSFLDGPKVFEGRLNLDARAWRTGRLVIALFDDDKPGRPSDFSD